MLMYIFCIWTIICFILVAATLFFIIKTEKEIIQDIINEMEKYIENNEVDYIDFHVWARDEQVAQIYNKNIKYIKDKIELSGKNKNIINLKEIFEAEDWGIKLNEYLREADCINKKQFLSEFDVDTLIEKIKNSNL